MQNVVHSVCLYSQSFNLGLCFIKSFFYKVLFVFCKVRHFNLVGAEVK